MPVLAGATVGVLAMIHAGCSSGSSTLVSHDDAGASVEDGSVADTGDVSDDGSAPGIDGDASPQPAPVFLEPAAYADLVTIDPSFPFGVTGKHDADGDILGSRWGRHGGPMVTTGVYGGGGATKVVRWDVSGGAMAAAVKSDHAVPVATGLPKTFFYGADGVVDLPFGPFALLSYTGSGASFPGEALLYAGDYGEVKSRAKVNGFYSGAGVVIGDVPVVVYSGLSPLSTATTTTDDCALYGAPVCDGALAAGAPCPSSWKIFGWDGQSGPVVTDAHGNVFVGASLSEGTTSDAVYALAKGHISPGAVVDAVVVAEIDSGGTASLAAIAQDGDAHGWVLGLGYDAKSSVYAADFVEQAGAIVDGSVALPAAIARADGVDGLSVFTDDDGDLWLAVTKGRSGTYLELRRKSP